MYYDLLMPSRLGDQHLPQLTEHFYRALRAESTPPPKEPDVAPRVSGDLLLPRSFRPPAHHYPTIPRWESERDVAGAWWCGETGDPGTDGGEDGSSARVDGA